MAGVAPPPAPPAPPRAWAPLARRGTAASHRAARRVRRPGCGCYFGRRPIAATSSRLGGLAIEGGSEDVLRGGSTARIRAVWWGRGWAIADESGAVRRLNG